MMEAVKHAGGEVRVWTFDGSPQAVYLGHNRQKVCSLEGLNTTLGFLTALSDLGPDWEYLFVTDAEVDRVPAVWDQAHRRRSTVVLIQDDYTDSTGLAAALGDRVLPVKREQDLPLFTALAGRRFLGTASRA